MEKFEWSDKYETGIAFIDKQHKELFQKIDNFVLAIYNGESNAHLKDMIKFLEEYINNHLKDEEELMLRNKYIDFYEHAAMHKKFIIIYEDFKNDFAKRGGDTYLAIRLEKEIRKWWQDHILYMDMLYVSHIEKYDEK